MNPLLDIIIHYFHGYGPIMWAGTLLFFNWLSFFPTFFFWVPKAILSTKHDDNGGEMHNIDNQRKQKRKKEIFNIQEQKFKKSQKSSSSIHSQTKES